MDVDYDAIERIRKMTPSDRRESLKQLMDWYIEAESPRRRTIVKTEILRMAQTLQPRRRSNKPHRYDKPVFRVINGGRS